MNEVDAADAALLDAWHSGDANAGRALFERHFALVARFFASKVGDEAEDLAQVTFMKCAEPSLRYERRSTVRAFLLGIANNVLLKHLRTRYARGRPLDFDDVTLRDLRTSVSARVARSDEQVRLADAFSRLPVRDQIVLELYYWEDMTAAELSSMLGVPEGTVRTRLRSAKARLRRRLQAESPALRTDH